MHDVDFYGSLNKFNNCGIFHLFSMYWYCKDHQTCPSSYESWQDLFNLNKKGITFSMKKNSKKKSKLLSPGTIQKESDSSRC